MKPSKLDPELEEGNIEYKRYLFNLTDIRYQQLLTQLQWRLSEGDGEAIYYIGVNDDGNYFELTRDQQKESISNIKRLIKDAKSKIISFDFNKYFIRVKFRLIEKKVLKREYRIILLGDHQVGKSTLLGYLTYQLKDDGKGGLRNRIANHKHELENEMTSSLTIKSFNYKENRYIWIDTPGNDKYKKTRHFALESYYPNLVIFVNGDQVWKHKKFYQEYLKLKGIPYLNIYTKIGKKFPQIDFTDPPSIDQIYKYIIPCLKPIHKEENKETLFLINKIYPSPDLGYIMSGFLKNGKMTLDDDYFISYQNKIFQTRISSIHVSRSSANKVYAPASISIQIEENIFNENKPKGSILVSSKENLMKTLSIFKVEFIYPEIEESSDCLTGYYQNQIFQFRINKGILISERALTLQDNIILAEYQGNNYCLYLKN